MIPSGHVLLGKLCSRGRPSSSPTGCFSIRRVGEEEGARFPHQGLPGLPKQPGGQGSGIAAIAREVLLRRSFAASATSSFLPTWLLPEATAQMSPLIPLLPNRTAWRKETAPEPKARKGQERRCPPLLVHQAARGRQPLQLPALRHRWAVGECRDGAPLISVPHHHPTDARKGSFNPPRDWAKRGRRGAPRAESPKKGLSPLASGRFPLLPSEELPPSLSAAEGSRSKSRRAAPSERERRERAGASQPGLRGPRRSLPRLRCPQPGSSLPTLPKSAPGWTPPAVRAQGAEGTGQPSRASAALTCQEQPGCQQAAQHGPREPPAKHAVPAKHAEAEGKGKEARPGESPAVPSSGESPARRSKGSVSPGAAEGLQPAVSPRYPPSAGRAGWKATGSIRRALGSRARPLYNLPAPHPPFQARLPPKRHWAPLLPAPPVTAAPLIPLPASGEENRTRCWVEGGSTTSPPLSGTHAHRESRRARPGSTPTAPLCQLQAPRSPAQPFEVHRSAFYDSLLVHTRLGLERRCWCILTRHSQNCHPALAE